MLLAVDAILRDCDDLCSKKSDVHKRGVYDFSSICQHSLSRAGIQDGGKNYMQQVHIEARTAGVYPITTAVHWSQPPPSQQTPIPPPAASVALTALDRQPVRESHCHAPPVPVPVPGAGYARTAQSAPP